MELRPLLRAPGEEKGANPFEKHPSLGMLEKLRPSILGLAWEATSAVRNSQGMEFHAGPPWLLVETYSEKHKDSVPVASDKDEVRSQNKSSKPQLRAKSAAVCPRTFLMLGLALASRRNLAAPLCD